MVRNIPLPSINKVVFINPYADYAQGINEATIYPPLGLAYISAVLEKHNIECKIIDAAVLKFDVKRIYHEVKSFNPDAIGISANIVTARSAIKLGTYLRNQLPEALLMFGGPYPTAEPEIILNKTNGDVVVRNEGELTIVDLIKNFRDLRNVKGISYRQGKAIYHNPVRELIEDLDSIPFPAYHLLPDFRLYRSRSRKTPIGFLLSSRGCPYGCIYCNKNIFSRRFRMRSPANVLTEIELLTGRYGVRQIDVLDDNFTLNIPRAEKILDEIVKRHIRVLLNFQNGVRADRLTPRLVRKMKLAGTYKVGIGIPGETGEAIQKTINFAIKANPHIANFSVVVPLPQTELFDIIKRNGKFLHQVELGVEGGFYSGNFSFEIGEINEQFIKKYVSRAYKEFYLRPKKIIDILSSVRSVGELHWIFDTAYPIVRFLCT
jgi:anaerobic magnesium-protoporphyrin IX monomethyl ester cyclase